MARPYFVDATLFVVAERVGFGPTRRLWPRESSNYGHYQCNRTHEKRQCWNKTGTQCQGISATIDSMPAGSLTLYRRHARKCPHRAKGRRWTRCNCGIWVQGSLGGQWIKDSLNTRDWSAAAGIVHGWEASGQIGLVKTDVP